MFIRKNHIIFKMINNLIIDLPSPSNISFLWNFGSLLGLCLIMQLITGIFLSMHYCSDVSLSFESLVFITREVNFGWFLRTLHANGASLFFICIYMHVGRGLYYFSFNLKQTWLVGVIILFLVMAAAFMGYVLPWGQMSFWGATVITNLLSAIPYLGETLVVWIWGGFAVDNATLNRFFSLHFLIPFIIAAMVMIHLMFLHLTGSNNPLGVSSNIDKIPFHYYFFYKDVFGMILMLWAITIVVCVAPNYLGDVENFIPANPLVTPTHIQPEWYFLFAYAILRSIPNKLGGVVALVMSIAILAVMGILNFKMYSLKFSKVSQFMFWMFFMSFLLLTWLGACPVEPPYVLVGQFFTVVYFFTLFCVYYTHFIWWKMLI